MKKTNRRNFLKTLTGLLTIPTGLCLAKSKQNKTLRKKYNRFVCMATGIKRSPIGRRLRILREVGRTLNANCVSENTSGKIIIHYDKINNKLGNYQYHITHDIEEH